MGTKITAAQVMIVRVVSELAAVMMFSRSFTGSELSCAKPRLPYIRTSRPEISATMETPHRTNPQPSRCSWVVATSDAANATTANTAVIQPGMVRSANSETAGQNRFWQTTNSVRMAATGQPQDRTKPRACSWTSPRDFSVRKVAPWIRNRVTNSTPPSRANGPNRPMRLPFHHFPSLASPIAKFANPTPSTSVAVKDP